ncbi:uncharacterized protein LOC128962363 [Oppia nitens]|uniref:uncharacterized protein LOC128962363 n=1 Tax=Oppia nitens TaxID=1686743 RepID=UPI0023DC7D2B|nr:uncharacterized protein LOC128962363 [Oppia nitens]
MDVENLRYIDLNAFSEPLAKRIEVFEMIGDNKLIDPQQVFQVINFFYSLKHLQEITITNGELNYISDNSFYLKYHSNQSLIIDLSNNNLTQFSFGRHSLVGTNRPIELDLRDNQLTVLEREIFRPFLSSNTKNSINLSANPINCQDCHIKWLVEDKHIFEDNVFEVRCQHYVITGFM